MVENKQLISVHDCPCDGCPAKPCGHPAKCVRFAVWLNKTVDAVVLPCQVGDTVYGQFDNYGKGIHECKVTKSKVCQFKDGSLHYFLDVEFYIIDPYYKDGRLLRCGQQAVFGEDFGSWYRVYRTREEVERVLYPCEYCFCGAYRSCEGCSYGERRDAGHG